MNCRLIAGLLAARDLLPEPLAEWLRTCCLEPHTRHCSRCRTRQLRLERLDECLRNWPAAPALARIMASAPGAAAVRPRRPTSVHHLGYAAAGLAGLLAGGLFLMPGSRRMVHRERGPATRDALLLPALPGRPADPPSAHGSVRPSETGFGALSERSVAFPRRRKATLASSAVSPRGPIAPPASAAATSDEQYLDGRDPRAVASWMARYANGDEASAWLMHLPKVEDDFVRVPLPRLASADPRNPAVGDAVRKYEQEAKIVDARLFRKITLKLKGSSLEEFCQAFEKETGVRVRPSRGVSDEQVTVLVDGVAARDVMRAVARLFGYFWSRTGEPGAYRYELFQDLKSQLAEEELRNRDLDAALLAVDAAMQEYLRDLNRPLEQLRERAEHASGPEKERLEALLRGGWGMAQVYRHLGPADLAALRRGEMLTFSSANPDPRRQLPAEWRPMLLETGRERQLDPSTSQFIEVTELPDAQTVVDLRLKRSELGQVTLEGSGGVFSPSTGLGGGIPRTLAVGQSPAVASPENARANRELRGKAPFTSVVTLRPEPQCPNLKRWYPFGTTFGSGAPNEGAMGAPRPHVDSAEVWEEVHRRSGLPIVADYYLRQYDLQQMTVERAPLFEALCRVGDRMGVRWKQDGQFLLGRSGSYFWEKLKAVPSRLVRRWQADAREPAGLPLRDLLEMASLSDAQLNSAVTAAGMRQCSGLEEWGVVGGGEGRPLRAYARFLALLQPAQLDAARSPAGLPLSGLTPGQQQEWLRLRPAPPADARLRVEYVPAGAYLWVPVVPRDQALRLSELDIVSGATPDAVLAQARRHYPGATLKQVRQSTGVLAVRVFTPEKELFRLGMPPVLQGG